MPKVLEQGKDEDADADVKMESDAADSANSDESVDAIIARLVQGEDETEDTWLARKTLFRDMLVQTRDPKADQQSATSAAKKPKTATAAAAKSHGL